MGLTVHRVARSWRENEVVAVTRRSIVLAILLGRTSTAASDPNIDLVVRASAANILHDQILLEVWEVRDVAWLVQRGAGDGGKCQGIVIRARTTCRS